MAKIEVYKNQSGTISGDFFATQLSEPTKKLSEKEIYNILLTLEKLPVENRKIEQDDIYAYYKKNDILVKLNEYKELSQDENIAKYMASISKNTVKKPKKAERKNKHANKLVAIAMSGAILLFAQTLNKQIKETKVNEKIIPKKTAEQVDETINIETQAAKNEIYTETAPIVTTTQVNTQVEQLQEYQQYQENVFNNNYGNGYSNNYNYVISLSIEDERDDEKYQYVKENYDEILNKYAEMYGIDVKLIKAIATQESGIHNPEINSSGAIGLMQVQYNIWVGQELSAYNFQTQEMEKIIDNKKKLSELEYSVKVGTMILRNYLERTDYNLIAATFGYNKGVTGVLAEAGEYLNSPEELNWLEDARNIPYGDDYYPEHVFRYVGPDENISIRKKDGSYINYYIQADTRTRTY